MSSKKSGKNIEKVKVTGVGNKGVSLDILGKEYHMSYKHFPWLGSLTAEELGNILVRFGDEIYFPDLDIELGLEVLDNPEQFPNIMDPTLKILHTLPRDTDLYSAIKTARESLESLPDDILTNIRELQETITNITELQENITNPFKDIFTKRLGVGKRKKTTHRKAS